MKMLVYCMVCCVSATSWCVTPQRVNVHVVMAQQRYAERTHLQGGARQHMRVQPLRTGTDYYNGCVELCRSEECVQCALPSLLFSCLSLGQ